MTAHGSPPSRQSYSLTRDQARAVRSALLAYEFETKTAMRGMRSTDAHDPCCERDRSRREAMAEMADALDQRAQDINDALAQFGPSLALDVDANAPTSEGES